MESEADESPNSESSDDFSVAEDSSENEDAAFAADLKSEKNPLLNMSSSNKDERYIPNQMEAVDAMDITDSEAEGYPENFSLDSGVVSDTIDLPEHTVTATQPVTDINIFNNTNHIPRGISWNS